jgi:hypothetical protein
MHPGIAVLTTWLAGFTPAVHLPMPDIPPNHYTEVKSIRLVVLAADSNPFKSSDLFSLVETMAGSGWMKTLADHYKFHVPSVVKLKVTNPALFKSKNDLGNFIFDQVKGKVPSSLSDGSQNIFIVFASPESATNISPSNTAANTFHGAVLASDNPVHTGYFSKHDAFELIVTRSTSTLADRSQPISHESIEAITDTDDGFDLRSNSTTPWEASPFAFVQGKTSAENADISAQTHHLIKGPGGGTFELVRPVDPKAVSLNGDPYLPSQPSGQIFYNTTVPSNWTTMSATDNATLTIPLKGWNTEKAIKDWKVKVELVTCGNGVTSWPISVEGGGDTINNDKVLNLKIKGTAKPIPNGWCVYKVVSTTTEKINDDSEHFWMFGVHQPKPAGCMPPEVWCECSGKPGWCTTYSACQHVCGGNIPGPK